MKSRARAVARVLMGSALTLESQASEEEINNSAFCAELDDEVRCCEGCGWWSDTADMDDDGICPECNSE